MTIRLFCKKCGSKLNAPDELRGQVRKCPKCSSPVLIEEASAPQTVSVEEEPRLKIPQLKPDNLYLILGSNKEIAYWKFPDGWLINLGTGHQSIKRAPEQIPDTGNYVLVEGYVKNTDHGKRLSGLSFSALQGRGVLKALLRSDVEILTKTAGHTTLTQPQKRFVLQHIRNHYFFDFTEDAPEIIEYLTGFDSHSYVVGKMDN